MVTQSLVPGLADTLIAALTPAQRFQALRNFQNPNPLTDHRFITGGLILVGILLVLLILVHYWQRIVKGRSAKTWFISLSKSHHLTWNEQKLLRQICHYADLVQIDAIFTMPDNFEKGVNELLNEKTLDIHADIEQLQAAVTVLRAKLGYGVQNSAINNGLAVAAITSTRQISPGTKIRVNRRKNATSGWMDAVITGNSDGDFTAQLPVNLGQISSGVWILQYDCGPIVLEFEAPVLNYQAGELSLGHTENIRVVSRRRFPRVPFESQALIALYQFDLGVEFDVPRFYKARVKQLAGPGMLVESTIKVSVGNRVLIIMGLPNGNFVQDVAIVRHVRPVDRGLSIAVEITGAKGKEFDELVEATNLVAHKMSMNNEPSVSGKN